MLTTAQHVLKHLGVSIPSPDFHAPTLDQARTLLAQRSRALLGRPREGRTTRIMVTLDAGSIHQPELLEQLLLTGMDIARINCAHDTAGEWETIIGEIRRAEERLTRRGRGVGRRCRILMDLPGPRAHGPDLRGCSQALEFEAFTGSCGPVLEGTAQHQPKPATETVHVPGGATTM